ncbi:aspartate/glutamate racemase family protein [Anaeroselena agilis]|uniref:Aspartate/glutamate racemase family protein n=1 Tax=Anaeroselena agilis TaxID=3063788 RepID=A0ABU3P098_9FIRM|nr:aspartate/glutamate racemase family protein [Selenomonadales bacterium 4137-cl]
MKLTGGYTNYGQDLGILMLDTVFPRLVGDIGNARTFPFPVRYKTVRGALPAKVVEQNDERLLASFVEGARELEAEGVKAVTTSCGFLAVFQRELAAAVGIPVLTSSLLQVPAVEKDLGPAGQIVIVTANGERLTPRHLAGAGIETGRHIIYGLEDRPEFYDTFVRQKTVLDVPRLQSEIEEAAREIRARFPAAGALVLECTNLPPFRRIFARVTGLPVYDILSLIGALEFARGPAGAADDWRDPAEPLAVGRDAR